jgi:hypothetical protein
MVSSNPSRRDDLMVMLLHGGAATNAIARHVVDAFAAEVRAEMAAERDALQARLNRVMDICDEAERAGITSGGTFTVRRVHDAALGDDVRKGGAR